MLPRHSLRAQWYYTVIAVKDSQRARTTLLTTSMILAGICLQILLLIGLKRGLVQKLVDDMLKSPSSVVCEWFATRSDLALDSTGEEKLLATLPQGAIIVPDITKIVSLSTATAKADNVTLQATVPHDPVLAYYGAGISSEADRSLIVSPAVAIELGLVADNKTFIPVAGTISLHRMEGDQAVTAELQVTISAVVGADRSKSKCGYLSRKLLDQFEDFMQGEAVTERGWSGRHETGTFGHQGFLAFTKRPYTVDDLNRLHLRGLKAIAIDRQLAPTRLEWRVLHGLLQPHELHVYFLTSEAQTESLEKFLDFTVNEIEDVTPQDDVLLYWSEPCLAMIDGKQHQVVGVSGSLRWLKSYYLSHEVRFTGNDVLRVMIPHAGEDSKATLTLPDGHAAVLQSVSAPALLRRFDEWKFTESLDRIVAGLAKLAIKLNVRPDLTQILDLRQEWSGSAIRTWIAELERKADRRRTPLAIVPSELLSAIRRQQHGTLEFDSAAQTFHRVNAPNKYFNGRIYAGVLENVPVIDERLQSLGYSTISSKLRVREMQGYAGTLDLLVSILQIVALFLGVATVSVLFMDITQRRQTSIGIMRIMGMEASGIFLFVFVRAMLVAVIGWLIASVIAASIALLLPLAVNAECQLTTVDFAKTFFGSVMCSAIGVVFHAYHAATRLDPIEAISAGKVQ